MERNVVQKEVKEPKQQSQNLTGIPAQMKVDFEQRSGLSFDDIRVHYHSEKPEKIGALAYTQGSQVYIGPGQERHLGHELGHVVQQKLGYVPAERTVKGISFNLDPALEHDADRIASGVPIPRRAAGAPAGDAFAPIQMRITMDYKTFRREIRSAEEYPVTEQAATDYMTFFNFEQELNYLIKPLGVDETKVNQWYGDLACYYFLLPDSGTQFIQLVHEIVEESDKEYNKLYTSNQEKNTITENQYYYGYGSQESPDLGRVQLGLHNLAYGRNEYPRIDPLNAENIAIRVIPFSQAQNVLPRGLINLIRDIYLNWYAGKVFDRRSKAEKKGKATASNTPGSLRSYHMNVQGSLPYPIPSRTGQHNSTAMADISLNNMKEALHNSPGNNLHRHYQATSQQDSAASLAQQGGSYPVGFAEYTGIGFNGGNPNECKIVLNYINGDIYLTLTHYQYYEYDAENQIINSKEKTPGSGPYNPWFKIDMQG